MLCHLTLLLLVGLCCGSIVKPSGGGGTFELLILHNNDMHARFEQTSQLSGACSPADRDAGKCYGGFPRVAHVVKEARKAAASGEGPPVLYLNAGDTYTGTAWFTIYKWKVAAEFLNALQPDAVSLGNNDFDGTNLAPFLENIDAPILTSNIKVQSDNAHKILRSTVIDIDGTKVGIIGYLTLDFDVLDRAGSIEYNDEVIILKEEVEKLQSEGVNIIIALGHSDYYKNIDIAREVEGLDLIINGHKNAFFWNGTNAENEGAYVPLKMVRQNSGKVVALVESYAYNKYLGKVIAKFNVEGELTDLKSEPILLDDTVPQDIAASEILQKYNDEISSTEIVGNTAVVLDGETCKTEECNFGNLVVDSIIYYYAVRFAGERWTDAAIAIIHGGALATRIAPPNRPAAVTRNDLLSALPESDNLVAVTITGQELLQLLEHAVADFDLNNPSGRFLQFSGLRVIYDLSRDPGSRVVSVVARCWNCFVPEFYTIDDWRPYKIIMPLSLANGGYGYSMLVDKSRETLAYDAITCTSEYMGLRSPVYPDVAGRVTLLNVDALPDENTTTETNLPTTTAPTTVAPTTVAPTTVEPTTLAPTTVAPTTVAPTTVEPTTVAPTTIAPTTVEPTTVEPTTVEPTTEEPTTVEPTTVEPTTVEPTTVEPTTVEPTTVAPTTVTPTTEEPSTDSASSVTSTLTIVCFTTLVYMYI